MDLETTDHLDLTDYLNSLLKESIKQNLIKEEGLQSIYIQIKDLFIKRAERFTLGDSSSLPEETATDLLNSITYTIGIELQSFTNLKEQIQILISKSINSIFYNGLEKVKKMLKQAKLYYLQTKKHMLRIGVIAYNDTLFDGLEEFFKNYDCDFLSHHTPGYIDYPLAYDKMDSIGVQYVITYLKKIYVENIICKSIDHGDLIKILKNYDKNYSVLLFNIFKVVVHNTIGCIIINRNPNKILLEENDCKGIYKRLSLYTESDYINIHHETVNFLLSKGLNNDSFSKDYINSIIFDVLEHLKIYIKYKDNYSFFVFDNNSSYNKMKFIDNECLDDSDFRDLLDEILSLRYTQDKIKMLNDNCRSIRDLIDLLNNDIFYKDEYFVYFSTLNIKSISLLLSFSLFHNNPIENNFIIQLENIPKSYLWQYKIINYIQSLGENEKKLIQETLLSLEDIS